MVRGTVLGIDRESGTVRAEIAGVIVPQAPYMGDPPWPLSACWFFNAPAWTCLGPIGNRRVAFADDFTFVRTAGSAEAIGETGWVAGGDAGGSLSTPANPTDASGALRLTNTTVGTGYYIRKSHQMVTLTNTRCVWMSARVRTSVPADGVFIGLADPLAMSMTTGSLSTAAGTSLVLYTPSSTGTILVTISGVNSQSSLAGEGISADTWVWADVMVVGGQWAAVWVDGSGPWVSTSVLPDTTRDSVTPYVSVRNAGASNTLDVDYVSLSLVDLTTTADPTTFGELDPVDDVLT